MNWRKDSLHPKHYFGPYTVFKLNNRKRSMVLWMIELDGQPISNERHLRDAKIFVEAHAKRNVKLTLVSVEQAGRLLALAGS